MCELNSEEWELTKQMRWDKNGDIPVRRATCTKALPRGQKGNRSVWSTEERKTKDRSPRADFGVWRCGF